MATERSNLKAASGFVVEIAMCLGGGYKDPTAYAVTPVQLRRPIENLQSG
jgi:hypothetical protein